jgi:hypothetical protein
MGLVERRQAGRAWSFRPVLSRGEHAARAMTAALHPLVDLAARGLAADLAPWPGARVATMRSDAIWSYRR